MRQYNPREIDESQAKARRQRDKQRPEHEPLVKGFARCLRRALHFLCTSFVLPLAAERAVQFIHQLPQRHAMRRRKNKQRLLRSVLTAAPRDTVFLKHRPTLRILLVDLRDQQGMGDRFAVLRSFGGKRLCHRAHTLHDV